MGIPDGGEAVLLIGHGTRDPQGAGEVARLAARVKEEGNLANVGHAFLGFAEPRVDREIAAWVSRGVKRFVAIPCLLFPSAVRNEFLPALREAQRTHPAAEFLHGSSLGLEPEMIDLAVARIRRQIPENPAHRGSTSLLFVGRGTLDPGSIQRTEDAFRRVSAGAGCSRSLLSYIDVCEPSFESELERLCRDDGKRVVVFSYFFFPGRLSKQVERIIGETSQRFPGVEIRNAGLLGVDPLSVRAVLKRIVDRSQLEALRAS